MKRWNQPLQQAEWLLAPTLVAIKIKNQDEGQDQEEDQGQEGDQGDDPDQSRTT